ncbi:MAG: hypothetical protein KGJ23_11060 [Euryarchaeota archaeon]|nr:hypothetical protein [Euryarchaeota archaeon]MDE2045182.1 hypothetical protein [Thermoplasmata archaeon]
MRAVWVHLPFRRSGSLPLLNLILLSAALVASALAIGGALYFASAPPAAPTSVQQLTLTVNVVPGTDHTYFSPGNLTLRTGVVRITIVDYDTVAAQGPPMAGQVRGLMGGTETVHFSLAAAPVLLSSMNSNDIAHTFSVADGTYYDINAPVPVAAGPGAPSQVTFLVYFAHPGEFTWWCGAVCGFMPMSPGGGMAGTLTITS